MTRMVWTEELVVQEIRSSMKSLNIQRMPTSSELRNVLGREDLHNKICRTKKYRGWAEELGLEMKGGETRTGVTYEEIMGSRLSEMGFEVEQMTTKHPYDILLDGVVKVDVKAANIFKSKVDSEWWAFHLAKEKPTCDIYILVALAAEEVEERVYVIPSQFVNMKTVNIGRKSKYDFFLNRFDFLKEFSDFYKGVGDFVKNEWMDKNHD